ncbi:MAG: dienelactone hydrolase family protein [Dongiaceae bacterium]
MTIMARRNLITGLAGIPLAAVLANPQLAALAAAGLATVSLKTASGREVSAALALPATTPAPAVLLIHEWWGLNDQIKTMGAELAKEGLVALAVDLYDGKVASDPASAESYMNAVDADQATETLTAWIEWLKADGRTTGKIGTVGWCFGGGWSLNASIAAPIDATVIYYGWVERPAADLAALKGPVLGQFAETDKWINHEMVAGFETEMAAAGKPLEVHWYSAGHGFANPTGSNHDKEDALAAWARTLAFFRANLA